MEENALLSIPHFFPIPKHTNHQHKRSQEDKDTSPRLQAAIL
jgi:hypothetical protein